MILPKLSLWAEVPPLKLLSHCFFLMVFHKATITTMQHVNANFDQLSLQVLVLSRLRLFAAPRTVALQAPVSVRFSRQKYQRGSSWPRDWTQVSCISGRFFTVWATWEALRSPSYLPPETPSPSPSPRLPSRPTVCAVSLWLNLTSLQTGSLPNFYNF